MQVLCQWRRHLVRDRGRLGGASYMPYATKIQATIHNFGGTDWKFQRGFWQASGCKDDVMYCVFPSCEWKRVANCDAVYSPYWFDIDTRLKLAM